MVDFFRQLREGALRIPDGAFTNNQWRTKRISFIAQSTTLIAMGYHITLKRTESGIGITEQEWRDFVASRPELKIVKDDAHFITTILDGDDNLALHYTRGDSCVFTKNPEGPRIIEYMSSIAPYLGGVVTGDEGETFPSSADWGIQSDWGSQTIFTAKPWWKCELSRGKRLMLGLLLGGLAFVIKQVFFPR